MSVRSDYEGRRPSLGELHANGDCYSSSCPLCEYESYRPRPCERCGIDYDPDQLEDGHCFPCAVILGWTDPPEEGTAYDGWPT